MSYTMIGDFWQMSCSDTVIEKKIKPTSSIFFEKRRINLTYVQLSILNIFYSELHKNDKV
jgi:hypothetical protein